MASPIFTTAMARARRRMGRHQRVPSSARLPMWRLLAGEVVYLARVAGGRAEIAAAVAVAVLVTAGLSPATPGPVAGPALRILIGAAAAAAVWAAVWVASRPGLEGVDGTPLWRQVASGFAVVLLAVAAVATLVWLVVVLVSLAV